MREPTHENEVGRVTPCAPDWEQIRPALDDAMHELKETDREAILLRYFENRQFAEVGVKLGLNENAARMRVERALEKLRAIFAKRGITTATALASVISANAVQLAPANLAVTLTTASIATAGTGTFTLLKIMTVTNLKFGISALVVAGTATAFVVQHQAQTKLRDEGEALRQQITQLQANNESLSNRLSAAVVAKPQSSQSLSNEQFIELLKLRGEVGHLKQAAMVLSNHVASASNPFGLLPEQMPPWISSGIPETAKAYARLVRQQATGQLTPAEELNLAKAWPYLEKRFSEPDGFAYFQSQYLADMLNITNQDTVWQIRRLLEGAREQEHAKGLRWARQSDEQLQHNNINLDTSNVREHWNELNQRTTEGMENLLSESERETFVSNFTGVLDFDSRLKRVPGYVADDPKFQNLSSEDTWNAFMPPQMGVKLVPAKKLDPNQ